MLVLIIVQLMMVVMFLGLGFLIAKKQAYWLISGFAMKPEEEQQELIENGYPQATAKGMYYSAYILLAGFILSFFNFENAILFSWMVMTIFLFAYLFSISKLDSKKSRRKNKIILGITMIFTIGLLGVVFFVGASKNELLVTTTTMQINGAYGVDWPLEEIIHVELVEELPKVQMRTNGFAYGDRLKGKFKLKDLGSGRLFLYADQPPFIFVQKINNDYLFINSKNKSETSEWFEELKIKVKIE